MSLDFEAGNFRLHNQDDFDGLVIHAIYPWGFGHEKSYGPFPGYASKSVKPTEKGLMFDPDLVRYRIYGFDTESYTHPLHDEATLAEAIEAAIEIGKFFGVSYQID